MSCCRYVLHKTLGCIMEMLGFVFALVMDSRYASRASMRRMRADVSSALHPIPLSATKALRDVLLLLVVLVEVVMVVDGKMSVEGDLGSKAAALTDKGLSSVAIVLKFGKN